MSRESTKAALDKFFAKQMPKKNKRGGKKNMAPERTLTEQPCFDWYVLNGFVMTKIESKAVYSKGANRYLKGQTDPGVADSFGVAPDGTAAFVEFKAPGRNSSLSLAQEKFLRDRIEVGAFAVCVDSAEMLARYWLAFQSMRLENRHKEYLNSVIPKNRLAQSESGKPDGLF